MKHFFIAVSFVLCFSFAAAADAETIEINDVKYSTHPEGLTEITIPKNVPTQAMRIMSIPSEVPVFTNWRGLLDQVPFTFTTTSKYYHQYKQEMYDNSYNTDNFLLSPNENVTFTFDQTQAVGNVYYVAREGGLKFSFYDENDDLLGEMSKSHSSNVANYMLSVQQYDVKKIVVTSYSVVRINEMEFDNIEIFNPVEKITATVTNKPDSVDAVLEWTNPIHTYLSDIEIDGESVGKVDTYTLKDLQHSKKHQITITTVYGAKNTKIDTIFELTTPKDTTGPGKVENLTAVQKGSGVLLSYDLPKDKDFSHVKISRDGVVFEEETTDTSIQDNSVALNKKYNYRIYAFDVNGNMSELAETSITVVSKEVIKLNAKAVADQVTLSWNNTLDVGFEKVIIYRKEKTGVVARFFSLFSSGDDFKPIFTTNGTIFEDLTVSSDTSYTYKVASVIEGAESDGVTIDVTTPKVTVGGGSITPEPSDPSDPTSPPGSYLVKWTSPTSGKLLVRVGGVDYKTVDASAKQISIPAEDMKFDKFGNFDVQLVPVDESGTPIGIPGKPGGSDISWGGVKLPDMGLDAKSLLGVVAALLGLIGLILLLAMSFRVVPKLIELLKRNFE